MTNGELRREWAAEELADNVGESDESLPEATTTRRYPQAGVAGGAEHLPGEEAHVEVGESATRLGLPDPPLHMDDSAAEAV